MANPAALKATDIAAARQNYGLLLGLREAYSRIIAGFPAAGVGEARRMSDDDLRRGLGLQ